MQNLNLFSDTELLLRIKNCVAEERKAIHEVLRHLDKVESRRLFAARGFSSLWEFTVKDLGYSESAAYRRIGAMRLLHSLPPEEKTQVEAALSHGQVSLSTLSSVQNFCRAEKIPIAEKFKLVQKTLGKTQRETDRMLATLSPEPFKAEKSRPLSETLTELRITLTKEQLAKLERAKEILSHQAHSWAELFEVMAEQTIKKSEPTKRDLKPAATRNHTDINQDLPLLPAQEVKSRRHLSRYISRPLKRQKFADAHHQCEFKDPETGRRCSAREHLEIDHIQPLAHGGATTANNLRVLCRAHNQFHALKSFGAQKMERHWSLSK